MSGRRRSSPSSLQSRRVSFPEAVAAPVFAQRLRRIDYIGAQHGRRGLMTRDYNQKQQDARILRGEKKAVRAFANAEFLTAQIAARSRAPEDEKSNPKFELAQKMFVAYLAVDSSLAENLLPLDTYTQLRTLRNGWLNPKDRSLETIAANSSSDHFLKSLQTERIASALSRTDADKNRLAYLEQLLQSFTDLRNQYRSYPG